MMEGAQILGFFDGSLPYPTHGTQYDKQQYTYQTMMAYTILLRNITPNQQQNTRSYRGYGNSAELAYNHLKNLYQATDSVNQSRLMAQLTTVEMKPGEKGMAYISRCRESRDKLIRCGGSISEDAFVTVIIGGLGPQWRSTRAILRAHGKISEAALCAEIHAEQQDMDLQEERHKKKSSVPEFAFHTQRRYNNNNRHQPKSEFKLYHGKGGLYIGKAVLKNNVFVLNFVPDLGTADSDGIVTFTSWTHPPDLDPDFSPEGFWYSHTIPEVERTRALATIQHSAAAETTSAATKTTSAAAMAAAAATSTPIAGPSTASAQIDGTPPTHAQQLNPKPREVHRSANFTTSFYSNSDLGIKRLISLPYANQQQGVAERMNRTLQNTMRKLLRGMRLPNHKWPEAMDHAVMLHNLLSSSSLPNNASPHLLWTGKQGSTKMLRVFGCMVQYRPPSARAGRFSQRAQWGLHLGIERNYNAWKIFDVHSKETVAARDVIFYKRLTLPTYLANLEEDRDPTGGFRGDRAFASAADEADWDEQNVDNASDEAGPLPYCSMPIPMDDENPRESVNAEIYFDLADNGYVTPAEVNTNEAERIGPNFIPDPETACHSSAGSGGEHREKWREAMDKELEALKERNTWKVVPIGVARNKTILTGKWVFRVKTKADGTIDKFKARWVVRGFDQKHGRDFTETFAPVSRHTSLRILLAIAAMKKRKLRQIDVANAFLYAPVDAEIYVELPHGSHGEPNQVCQLQKSLYGIKQAPRLWQQYLHARLTRIEFQQLPHDQGMYRLTKGDDYILLIVYIDDLLYIRSTDNVTTWFEGELQRDLTLTVSSTVTQYLGLNIQEGESAKYLNAAKYADNIAKRFALTPTTISTPYRYMSGNNKAESAPLKPAGIRDQRKLGCLLFAAVTCRPDLSYSASQLATYLKRPEAEHMAELDRALHYLDEIEKGRLELSYCPTSEMAADYLTKKLGKSKFEDCMLLTGQSYVTSSDTPEAKGSVGNN
ncbi:unnamed protein product [Closterium sp. NIES-54]